MKDLRARRGADYVQDLVDQGEHVHQDFKYLINDARKIARSISAFANNDGGSLLIGVKDNGVIAGVRNEEDVYVVEQAASLYCKPSQHVDFEAFKCGGGVIVIRATVHAAVKRPVQVDEGRGQMRAYFRVADENIVAHPLMVHAWRLANDSRSAMSLSLSDNESQILNLIFKSEALGITPEQLTANVMVSQRTLNDILVRLLALNLITFKHDGHKFVLVTVSQEP